MKESFISISNVADFVISYKAEEIIDERLLYIKSLFEDDLYQVLENVADRYSERVLMHLDQHAELETPEMRELVSDIEKFESEDIDGWKLTISGNEKLIFLDQGTRPHYIPRNARTEAYAKAYGIPFAALRGGIAKHGTKPVPILDTAKSVAETELRNGIRDAVQNVVKSV